MGLVAATSAQHRRGRETVLTAAMGQRLPVVASGRHRLYQEEMAPSVAVPVEASTMALAIAPLEVSAGHHRIGHLHSTNRQPAAVAAVAEEQEHVCPAKAEASVDREEHTAAAAEGAGNLELAVPSKPLARAVKAS